MNKQKLMSVLQSRIAKRRKMITFYSNSCEYKYTKRISLEQKEDKQILKQLVEDERELKKWKVRFGRYVKLPPIEGDLIAGMREG